MSNSPLQHLRVRWPLRAGAVRLETGSEQRLCGWGLLIGRCAERSEMRNVRMYISTEASGRDVEEV